MYCRAAASTQHDTMRLKYLFKICRIFVFHEMVRSSSYKKKGTNGCSPPLVHKALQVLCSHQLGTLGTGQGAARPTTAKRSFSEQGRAALRGGVPAP